MTILVTGGAGYIGSHMVLELLDAGIPTVVIDDLSTGQSRLVDERANFCKGDIGDIDFVRSVIKDFKVDTIIHFASKIKVNESLQHPLRYYEANTLKTYGLLKAAVEENVTRFIFSSTAAVYAESNSGPRKETDLTLPPSPYGASKLMSETMIVDAGKAYGLSYACLRYFNVAGADPLGRSGQTSSTTSDVVSAAIQTAVGEGSEFQIFGTDYDTPDGTCVRDYIHVSDLIKAHSCALEYLAKGGESLILNCGYGKGHSVREIVECTKKQCGVDFHISISGRRKGDLPVVIADISLINEKLDWKPKHDNLEDMIGSALRWHKSSRSAGQG